MIHTNPTIGILIMANVLIVNTTIYLRPTIYPVTQAHLLYVPLPWATFAVCATAMGHICCMCHCHGPHLLYVPLPWDIFLLYSVTFFTHSIYDTEA